MGQVVINYMDEANPEHREALRRSLNKHKEHLKPRIDLTMSDDVGRGELTVRKVWVLGCAGVVKRRG